MKKYLQVILLLLLAASIVVYNQASAADCLPEMKGIAGQGSELKRIGGQLYEARRDGELLGYFDRQSAVGYAGPIEALVFIGADGKLKEAVVVSQTETPSFFSRVVSEGFIKKLKGKEANSLFELGADLDAVTRATYTSRGIAEAVRKASHHIAVAQLQLEAPESSAFKLPLEDYLLLALLAAVFVWQKLKWSKARILTFLAGFILIGWWQKSLLTLGNLSSVLSGNIPWQNAPFWVVLLVGVFLLILIGGQNPYCFWICPYGALSELLGAFGKFGRMNYRPCEQSRKKFKDLRLFLAWGALVFAFIMKNPSISSYEVFAPLFAWQGSPVQWLLLPVMLFAGVFIFRFWCRFFCPVGGILDLLVKVRRSCVQWLEHRVMKNKPGRPQADRNTAEQSLREQA